MQTLVYCSHLALRREIFGKEYYQLSNEILDSGRKQPVSEHMGRLAWKSTYLEASTKVWFICSATLFSSSVYGEEKNWSILCPPPKDSSKPTNSVRPSKGSFDISTPRSSKPISETLSNTIDDIVRWEVHPVVKYDECALRKVETYRNLCGKHGTIKPMIWYWTKSPTAPARVKLPRNAGLWPLPSWHARKEMFVALNGGISYTG